MIPEFQNKLQEYLWRKELKNTNLPIIWIFKSNRSGVSVPKPIQCIKIESNCGTRTSMEGKQSLTRYSFEDATDILIPEGEPYVEEQGISTGFGDLWQWSMFYCLTEDVAKELFEKETSRISKKYKNGHK